MRIGQRIVRRRTRTKLTRRDGKLFSIRGMNALEGTRKGIARNNNLDASRMPNVVKLGDIFVACVAKMSVTKAKPSRNHATMSAFERHSFNAMIRTSTTSMAEELLGRHLIEAFTTSTILLAAIKETSTLEARKEIDLVIDLPPLSLRIATARLWRWSWGWLLARRVLDQLLLLDHPRLFLCH